ncbi:hypothetical protein HHK36_014661 [Tetracentron sinense]|uniref:ditrans,polycis-polyprenyl diphosphate synthase [(2E,6E)-farnesyldiphosphate specific] n=1 Tax=Tetracentron sinense TaxID=13715 RepID=A0A834Z317_TETSI|nr:hypothetical protein HHK36_014661 [Tetracentron sinense]
MQTRIVEDVGANFYQSSCVHQIGKFVLRLPWHFLHLAASIWYCVLDIAHALQSYLISSGLLAKYKSLNLSTLQYLAIVIESEDARHTSRVVELVRWLSNMGVMHVCLYDMDGVLKESKEIILEKLGDARLWKETGSDARVLSQLGTYFAQEADENDSFLGKNKMTLEFVSFSDGKEGTAKAANFICSKFMKFASLGGDQEEPVLTETNMSRALRTVGLFSCSDLLWRARTEPSFNLWTCQVPPRVPSMENEIHGDCTYGNIEIHEIRFLIKSHSQVLDGAPKLWFMSKRLDITFPNNRCGAAINH